MDDAEFTTAIHDALNAAVLKAAEEIACRIEERAAKIDGDSVSARSARAAFKESASVARFYLRHLSVKAAK